MSPLQESGLLNDRTMVAQSDHLFAHFNPWRKSDLGDTSASITIPCPAAVSADRKVQVAVQTLYATATGTGAKVTIKSGTDVILEYLLEDGFPLMMSYYPGNVTVEPGEDLVIEVTGATDNASVTATGVFYR